MSSNSNVVAGEAEVILGELIERRTSAMDEDLSLVGEHMYGRDRTTDLSFRRRSYDLGMWFIVVYRLPSNLSFQRCPYRSELETTPVGGLADASNKITRQRQDELMNSKKHVGRLERGILWLASLVRRTGKYRKMNGGTRLLFCDSIEGVQSECF